MINVAITENYAVVIKLNGTQQINTFNALSNAMEHFLQVVEFAKENNPGVDEDIHLLDCETGEVLAYITFEKFSDGEMEVTEHYSDTFEEAAFEVFFASLEGNFNYFFEE